MSIALAVSRYQPTNNPDEVVLIATLSGNYVAGGDTINLNPASWSDPKLVGVLGSPITPPAQIPTVICDFTGASIGTQAQVVPGATLATYRLQFTTALNTELAAAAYPAGMLAGQVNIRMFI